MKQKVKKETTQEVHFLVFSKLSRQTAVKIGTDAKILVRNPKIVVL